MSAGIKVESAADVGAPLAEADFAELERRILASMTPAELAAGYARRGYRRVSRRHCLLTRVDREDWLEALAAHLGRSVAALYRMREADNTLGYVVTGEVDPRWADYYRRVLSKDEVVVSEDVMLLVPSSTGTEFVGYVSEAQVFREACGGALLSPTGRAREATHFDERNVRLTMPCLADKKYGVPK